MSEITESLDEEILYMLLNCTIEPIMKSTYRILWQMYKSTIPKIQYGAEESWEEIKEIFNYSKAESSLKKDKKGAKKKKHITTTGDNADNAAKLEDSEEEEDDSEEEKMLEEKYDRYSYLNRNISIALVDAIENPPDITAVQGLDVLKEGDMARTHDLLQGIITKQRKGIDDQYVLSLPVYAYFLTWNALLHKIHFGAFNSRVTQNKLYLDVLNSINVYFDKNPTIYQYFLVFCIAFLPPDSSASRSYKIISEEELINYNPAEVNLFSNKDAYRLTFFSLFNFMTMFPTLARNYYTNCSNVVLNIITQFVTHIIGPAIWSSETLKIQNSQVNCLLILLSECRISLKKMNYL